MKRLSAYCLLLTVLIVLAALPGSAAPLATGDSLATPCTPGAVYDPACDVDQNGVIDVTDIQLTAGHWSQSGVWTGGGGWELTGNAGTTPGVNYVGTSDDTALQLHVRGLRALRIEPVDRPGSGFTPNLLGGHPNNAAIAGTWGATISGGGSASQTNIVSDSYGTVGGGLDNQAGNLAGTTSDRLYATVGGGFQNRAQGHASTVAGGEANQATAQGATVPGGTLNRATGDFSFAAGQNARALHTGAFVWSDAANLLTTFDSTQDNEIRLRAKNGVDIVASSDSNYGLSVANSGASNLAAFFDGNVEITGTCTGCLLAAFGVNAGERALQPGDVVTIRGVSTRGAGGGDSLWQVAPAQAGQAVVGVVVGKAEQIDGDGPLTVGDGIAHPGEYVTIIYSGPVRVRLASAAGVAAGVQLTAAADGTARPLEMRSLDGMAVAEGAPILGVALDAADPVTGLTPVLITLR